MGRLGALVRSLALCGLALTTLGFLKTEKNTTIVTYPTFGVSRPVADMPDELSMFPFQAMPEPGRSPNKPLGNGLTEDPVLQKEPLGPLNIISGIDFDGIASNGYAPSDSNMAVGPN